MNTPPVAPMTPAPATSAEAALPQILVVDDRPGDLRMLASLLEDPGQRVVTASSGPEALRRVLEGSFAVILLDVFMPEMDGFEVASLLRQREQSRLTPIIFLTAAGHDVGAIYRAYSVGAVDYLVKPLDERIVRAKVSTFVDLYAKDRQIREQDRALREADRRERELQLAEARMLTERRYRGVVETIPASVWTADAAGRVDYCNHHWIQFTGMSLEDARGDGWLAAVHPDDAARVEPDWKAAVAGGGTLVCELRLRRADGNHLWHLCHAVPEPGRRDAAPRWLGMFAECEELKRAVEARDEFLSIASHELRTPLTTLLLQLDSLVRQSGAPDVDPRFARRISVAAAQARRLDALVGSLLDVSHIAAGRLELEPTDLDLCELVRQCVDRFAEQAVRAGSTMSFDGTSAPGRWDAQRLEQVVGNLLSNALKYGDTKPVRVHVEAADGAAVLQVVDQGFGIAQEDQERIFGRFERAVPSRNFGGLGMGLYISRHIVESHGGTIDVTSAPGEGSTFTVRLPQRRDDA